MNGEVRLLVETRQEGQLLGNKLLRHQSPLTIGQKSTAYSCIKQFLTFFPNRLITNRLSWPNLKRG